LKWENKLLKNLFKTHKKNSIFIGQQKLAVVVKKAPEMACRAVDRPTVIFLTVGAGRSTDRPETQSVQ